MLHQEAQHCSSTWKKVESGVKAEDDATPLDEHTFFLFTYLAMHNSFDGSPVNLLYDQRIRHDKYAQNALSRYLDDDDKLM
jgi:hypothetical protein